MSEIPEFDAAERALVEAALHRRYGKAVAMQAADVELRLAPGDPQLTTCPTLYWEERGAAFAVAKLAPSRWRGMFFYPGEPGGEQYGAGRPEYDALEDCVTALLRAQADHEKQRLGVATGDTAQDFANPGA